MGQPTGGTCAPQLPAVPECSVERLVDGRLLLTHKRSGGTAVASDDGEDLAVQGAILRCLAAYPWVTRQREVPFQTGDLS